MPIGRIDWTGPIGGNWAYMVKNRARIGEFIKAKDIKSAVIEPRLPPGIRAKYDLDIRGGIRAPHLHFNSKIYLLDAPQWAEFSGGIMADLKAQLKNVKEVSFEAGMVLGNVAEMLPKG